MVQGSAFMLWSWGKGCMITGLELRVYGLGLRVYGLGFRV
jgi:hypothetical protein